MKKLGNYVPTCMMQKLLSLVVAFSLVWASVTPALGQAAAAGRGMRALSHRRGGNFNWKSSSYLTDTVDRQVAFSTAFTNSKIQQHVLTGNVAGHADFILQSPTARLMHHDFVALNFMPGAVSPAQRLEALSFYKHNLQANPEVLHTPHTNLTQFLHTAQTNPADASVQAVENVLADAAAVALLGTREQVPVLMDFYTHAQGTIFADTATIITSRGLLRMQAYDELGRLLAQHSNKAVLSGITSYIKEKHLPVEIPADFPETTTILPVNTQLGVFLQNSLLFGNLYADSSLEATRSWMSLQELKPAVAPARANSAGTAAPRVTADAAIAKETDPAALTEEPALSHANQVQPEVISKPMAQPAQMPASEPVADQTPRWIEVETTNALGNTVKTWQPNPAHPDYAQLVAEQSGTASTGKQLGWLERARLNWALHWKPTFQNMFNFGTSRYGVAGLGAGATPLTGEAAVAQAADIPAVVQTIRAQEGMFISEEALRGGAGASYRTGAVNPGGVAAQQYALQTTRAAEPTLAGVGYLAPSTLSVVRPWLKAAALVPAGLLGASLVFGTDAGLAEGLQTTLAMSPILGIPSWRNWSSSEVKRANRSADSTLSQQYPLITSLKDILISPASSDYQEKAILQLYHMGALSHILATLPAETRQKIQELTDAKDWRTLSALLLSLYHSGIISSAVNNLSDNIPVQSLLNEVGSIVNTPEFRAQAMARFNQQEKLSAAEGSFEGDVPLPSETDIEGIASTFREKEGFVVPQGEDMGSVVYYAKNVPFYYRNSRGEISAEPVGVLSQEKAGKLNRFLSAVPHKLLADKPGFYIAKGFILVLDEQGQWKLMVQPGKLSVVESIPASQKLLTEIRKNGSKHVAVDTPYTIDQLLAMAKVLEVNPNRRLQLTLNAPSSFRQFLRWFGLYIGMDSANSLTGPYKQTMGVTSQLGWPSTLITNFIGGFGYVSPWIGGIALRFMTKWGYSKSILSLFGVAGTALLVSWLFLGMDGWSDFPAMVEAFKADPHNMTLLLSIAGQLALPLTVAVITGSLFGALVPIILNIYKDPTARTAANLQFATTKQWSRLILTAATAAIGSGFVEQIWGKGDWTIVVPFATVLLGFSALLFFNTPIMKNAQKEHEKEVQSQKEQEEKWRAAGLDPQEMYKQRKQEQAKETKEFAKDYSKNFRHTPAVESMVTRVRGVYWAYAASLMMIGQIVNELLGTSWGQVLSAGFMLATLFMRKYATRQVSNKEKTDDQLTGFSIPLLAGSAALLTVMPYQVALVGIATALVAAAHYVGTAVPGQLDNTRMQNMVSAMIQEQKQAVLDNPNLTKEQKDDALSKLKRKEKDWASRASASYSYANGWGEGGVVIAALLGLLFIDQAPDFAKGILSAVRDSLGAFTSLFTSANLYGDETDTLTMQRFVFLISTGVLSFLTVKNWDLTTDYLRSFRAPKLTAENIADGKVNAATFGISAKNAKQNLSKTSKEMDKLKEKMVIFGVVSEKKMTDMYNQLVMSYNRLVAVREIEGMTPTVKANFDKLYALTGTYMSLLAKHKMSMMLEREFEYFVNTISERGNLSVVPQNPMYMPENQYKLPQAYEKFEEAKMLIQEMNLLAGQIRDGKGVQSTTYRLFIDYYNRVRDNLVTYSKLNVADSNRVLVMESELTQICLALKKADAMSGILETNKGPGSVKDVQSLRDLLNGVADEQTRQSMNERSFEIGTILPAY